MKPEQPKTQFKLKKFQHVPSRAFLEILDEKDREQITIRAKKEKTLNLVRAESQVISYRSNFREPGRVTKSWKDMDYD